MFSIGSRIKESREAKGLLQSQLAQMIGVKSAGVISNWEQDVSKPDANKMVRLCEALGISLSYLLDYYGEEKAPLYSSEAMKLAADYDKLDGYGQRMLRLVADEEKARCDGQARSSPSTTKLYVAARDGSRIETEIEGELTIPDESDEIP